MTSWKSRSDLPFLLFDYEHFQVIFAIVTWLRSLFGFWESWESPFAS